MLTERQIDILVFLINTGDWIISEILSNHFGLNKKTIQQEIKEISISLDDEITIASSRHKGYHIEKISEKALGNILSDLNKHEGRDNLPLRQSSFALYLLFLKTFISMQSLADIFFMSKTAVSLEVNIIKRWIDRTEGLTLEINSKSGIIIRGDEKRKRIFCCKFGSIKTFNNLPFPEELKEEFKKTFYTVSKAVTSNCINYNVLLTGEEVVKITNYLTNSIIRSKMGYTQDRVTLVNDFDRFILSIRKDIEDELGYRINDDELCSLGNIINESNTFNNIQEPNEVMERQISSFLLKVSETVDISPQELNINNSMFSTYANKMKLRSQSGTTALNHYEEDIVLRYPLEVYLSDCFFTEIFSLAVNKETSFIALFLSSWLYPFKNMYSILLVSNQNSSIAESIKSIVINLGIISNNSNFEIMPVYLYEYNPDVRLSYDILLTTDQKVVLTDNSFFLISPIISSDEIEYLKLYFQKRLHRIVADTKNKIRKQISYFSVYRNDVNFRWIDNLLSQSVHSDISFHTFSDHNLYTCQISNKELSTINIYELKEPVTFRYKKIKKIIYVNFNANNPHIFLFFEIVSEILNQNK